MEQRSIGGIKYEHPRQGYESVFGGWLASGDLPELVVGENTKYPSPGVWFETGAFEEVVCDVLLIDFARKDTCCWRLTQAKPILGFMQGDLQKYMHSCPQNLDRG